MIFLLSLCFYLLLYGIRRHLFSFSFKENNLWLSFTSSITIWYLTLQKLSYLLNTYNQSDPPLLPNNPASQRPITPSWNPHTQHQDFLRVVWQTTRQDGVPHLPVTQRKMRPSSCIIGMFSCRISSSDIVP